MPLNSLAKLSTLKFKINTSRTYKNPSTYKEIQQIEVLMLRTVFSIAYNTNNNK
jgi:hypothetical protein